MSLILDALKKLEREKDAREPGVLVVGSVPWGARARSRLPLAAALAGTGLVALVAFALWPRDRPARPAAAPSPVASAPALAPATPAVPPAPAVPRAAAPPGPAAVRASAAPPPEARRLSVPTAAVGPAEVPSPGSASAEEEASTTSPSPSRAEAPAPDDLHLNAISQRDGRPVALINDRLLFEGDSFDGVKILRIGETEVEVEVRGKRRVLRF